MVMSRLGKILKKKHREAIAVLAVFLLVSFGVYFLEKKSATLSLTETDVARTEIIRGDDAVRQVIFTFDGGASAESGEAILAALKKHGVTGTFFLTGKFAEGNPELVKKIAREGHEVFNHTYSHADLTTLSDEEIKNELARADAAIKNLTGESTKPYFRAPYGARNEQVLKVAADAGYTSVYWTTDVLDWKESEGFTAHEAKARIFGNLEPGALYLMHIGDRITGEILDETFAEVLARGYTITSLAESAVLVER